MKITNEEVYAIRDLIDLASHHKDGVRQSPQATRIISAARAIVVRATEERMAELKQELVRRDDEACTVPDCCLVINHDGRCRMRRP